MIGGAQDTSRLPLQTTVIQCGVRAILPLACVTLHFHAMRDGGLSFSAFTVVTRDFSCVRLNLRKGKNHSGCGCGNRKSDQSSHNHADVLRALERHHIAKVASLKGDGNETCPAPSSSYCPHKQAYDLH